MTDDAAYRAHDLAGRALEIGLTYDQLDITNSAMAEVIGRMYSLVEETSGSMQMEGVEYFVGRDGFCEDCGGSVVAQASERQARAR